MKSNTRVLVTGGAGYIGAVLVRQLLERGCQVRVLDNLMYGIQPVVDLLPNPRFDLIRGDIRESKVTSQALEDVDNVIHLACIVGDPACQKNQKLATEVNLNASISLADNARKKGIRRFIFASTCSNYGKMSDPQDYVSEESPLQPVSHYARLKVSVEQYLLSLSNLEEFTPVCLRFATAYGLSPRMRFDLTVNEFSKELALGRELVVYGAQFWRPYCHVEDLSNACVLALKADRDTVLQNVFNVGDTSENYQKKTLVELVKARLQNVTVKFVQKNEDPRDYRVRFEKIRNLLGFQITHRVVDGIDEIIKYLSKDNISDPDSAIYSNV